jgi:hypothetical protein
MTLVDPKLISLSTIQVGKRSNDKKDRVKQHLQRLSPHALHWPTVDEGLDKAALTSVSLMHLGRRNATTGGSGNNLASVSLFSISFQ